MRLPLRSCLVPSVLFVTCALARAQTASLAWSDAWDGPASQDDWLNKLAIDAQGNVYVAGRSYDASIGIPPAPPTQDALLVKYDAFGTLQWARRLNALGDDVAQDLALDPSTGDVVIAGYTSGYVGGGYQTDVLLARFDSAGTNLWTVTHDGAASGYDAARAVVVAATGSIFVGATSWGGPASDNDLVVWEFDASGAFQWEARVDGPGHAGEIGGFVALHPAGGVVLAGQFSGAGTAGDVGAARVDASGTILWQRQHDGAAHQADLGLGVACDASGGVYVCGYTTEGADQDPVLVHWDASGAEQWTAHGAELAPGNGQYRDLALDPQGRPAVVGHGPSASGGLDLVVASYAADGTLRWEQRQDGAAHKDDTSRAIAVDGASRVYACGWSNGPSGTTSDADSVVLAYDADGTPMWQHPGLYGANEDRAMDLALGPAGAVVYGAWLHSATSYDVLVVQLTEQGVPFCFGDGTATACPCGNASAPGDGAGCANSLGHGAQLRDQGYASLTSDSLVLRGSGMANGNALYIQGTTAESNGAGTLLGDGLLCAGGTIIRLGAKVNAGGASQFPGAGNPSVSVRGQVFVPGTRVYQIWYRNAATFCTPATFDLSNGLLVTWGP